MALRAELSWPEARVLDRDHYSGVVTLHGTLMVFFAVAPAFLCGWGHYVVPLLVGARNTAVPLLNRLAFGGFLVSATLMLASLVAPGGPPPAGWTAIAPFSALESAAPGLGAGQTLWLAAMLPGSLAFAATGLNLSLTVWKCRAPGMTAGRLPIVVWAYLVASLLALVSQLVLGTSCGMLLLDRAGVTSFFLPETVILSGEVLRSTGGDPLLQRALFGFAEQTFAHGLLVLALGLVLELLPVFTRRPPRSYRGAVAGLWLVGVLGLASGGKYLPGLGPRAALIASLLALLPALPLAGLGVLVVSGLRGLPRPPDTPLLFALGALAGACFAALGGLYLAGPVTSGVLEGTFFELGHLHFFFGGVLFLAVLAASYYWLPKVTGRKMSETLGRVHFGLTALPLLLLYALMESQGAGGVPRHVTESRSAPALELAMTGCATLVFAAQALFAAGVVWSAVGGEVAGKNPWKAGTLEWTIASPASRVRRWAYEYRPRAEGSAPEFLSQVDDS